MMLDTSNTNMHYWVWRLCEIKLRIVSMLLCVGAYECVCVYVCVCVCVGGVRACVHLRVRALR